VCVQAGAEPIRGCSTASLDELDILSIYLIVRAPTEEGGSYAPSD
jgi:hypothetical protein